MEYAAFKFGLIKLFMDDLMESSSSSEDEDFSTLGIIRNHTALNGSNIITKLIEQYSETEFRAAFRMSRRSANYLIDKFANSSFFHRREYKGGKQQIPCEVRVYAFLWFCVNKTTYKEVGNLFNMTISVVHETMKIMTSFMVQDIAPTVIFFPEEEIQKEGLALQFEQISGIPNVLGCIAESFVLARTPKHKIRSSYANRNNCISLALQGICDEKLKFLDVFVDIPSKIHESRIFKKSLIQKEISNICGSKYYVLGDSAYPLREYLLTPFNDNDDLSEEERNYNTKFNETYATTKNAFSLLKARFRQLQRLDFHDISSMTKFIISCCALHNICIDMDDMYEFDNDIDEASVTDNGQNNARANICSELGKLKRNEVKLLLTDFN